MTPWDDYISGSITYDQYKEILSIRRAEHRARSERRLRIAERIGYTLMAILSLATMAIGIYTFILAAHL